MWNRPIQLAFILICAASLQFAAATVSAETWNVSLSTTGDDVFWASPSAVSTGFPEYDWSFQITKINANLGGFINRNLLDELETTLGAGTAAELPVVLVDDMLSESLTGSTADIRIEIDADGFGRGAGTNIELGSFIGIPIRRVDFEATISVIGIPTGDYTRDGVVDASDFEKWREDFGWTTDLAADGNGNQVVDAADYTVWRDHFGSGMGAHASLVVPEPGGIWPALGGIVMGTLLSGRRASRKFQIS